MPSLLAAFLPLIAILVGFALLFGAFAYYKAKDRRYPRHSPLTKNMLRPPGHSLRKKIDDLSIEIEALLVGLCVAPLLIFSVHLSQSHFARITDTSFRWLITAITLVCLTILVTWLLAKKLSERKFYTLGIDGELAVGEELNQLMLDKCRVYHDIPFPYGNIDHVVVSHSGVYSVNTKMVGKPKEGGSAHVIVDHNKNVVHLPDRDYPIPTKQLECEANWLSNHLTNSVGEAISVEPMLALPGWYIKERIGRSSVYVINPDRPHRFFVQNRQVLSEKQIEQIAHQLEQLCRNIEPVFKEKRGWGD